MKLVYTSPLCGYGESAECVHVYEFENEDEFWELNDMTFEEKCELFGVYEEPDYAVPPGGLYHRYDFHLSGCHVIVSEGIAYNV